MYCIFNQIFMKIKAWVLDRFEQTFFLFKDNFIFLILPIFLYNIFWFIFSSWLFLNFIYRNTHNINLLFDLKDFSEIYSFFYNIDTLIFIFLLLILFILYLLFYIPFILWTIRIIKQAENSQNIDILQNIKYWFSRLLKSFNTYWYIFWYIAWIPSLLFIIWWILFNLWFFFQISEQVKYIWLIFMWIWTFLFLIFMVYRWIKTSFSIISATREDSFDKKNFLMSISITKNNWWRILWNLLLVWIIISFVSQAFSSFLNLILWYSFPLENIDKIDSIESIMSHFSVFNYFIFGILEVFLNTIGFIFITVFSYLFYLRISREIVYKNKTLSQEKTEL